MNGYQQYHNEVDELLKGSSKKYKQEIIETLQQIENFDELSYEKLIVLAGSPNDFITEFLENRIVSFRSPPNKYLLHGVRTFNYLLFIIIIFFIFLIPFYESKAESVKRSTFQLSIEQEPMNLIVGPFLLIMLFFTLEYYQRRLLYGNIHNLVDYFKIFRSYIVFNFVIYLFTQIYFIQSAFDIVETETIYFYGGEPHDFCYDLGWDCDASIMMWNTMQWFLLWMLTFQMLSLLIIMIYRLQNDDFVATTFEHMEKVERDTRNFPQRINQIYKLNTGLILLIYFPAFFSLFLNPGSPYNIRVGILVFSDLIITILIILQALIFIGLAYSHRKVSTPIIDSDFSCRKNLKYQLLYGIYFISTTFPDFSFANTDGFIGVTTFVALPFILGMWALEYDFTRK